MIRSLRLQHIRSYDDSLYEFEDGVHIVVGPNASGKTTLLEGVAYASQGKSFKGTDQEVMRHDETWARIDADFSAHRTTIKLQQQEERVVRAYEIDEKPHKRFPPSFVTPLVLFEPNHLLMLSGEPGLRRAYLDELLAKTVHGYETKLLHYRRALAQRNALLKQRHQSTAMFVWNLRLSELGGVLHTERQRLVEYLNSELQQAYTSLSGKQQAVTAHCETAVHGKDYTTALLARLEKDIQKDTERGFTGVGPHREDMVVLIDGYDVRTHASRGESRSVLVALKILEMRYLEEKLLKRPLLLLDDVFGELDGYRRQALAASLDGYQAFITTTDADLVMEHFSERYKIILAQN